MATYNGAEFVEAQLASIAGQITPPLRAGACLVRSTARGDCGRPDRGGLGRRLLVRDVRRVAQIAARRPA